MRTAVTLLDSYRYYRDGEFFTDEAEQKSLHELIARIRGEKIPQNEAMLRGIAFHEIMEDPVGCYDHGCDVYVYDGWQFDAVSTGEVLMDLPPDRVCEVKMVEEIGDVQLVGVADYIEGLIAGDYKLTKKVVPDKFHESIQWKAYCKMADLLAFKYHVMQPRENRNTGVISLHDYKVFTYYRDEKTDRDVERLCEEFYDFAQPYLQEDVA